MLALEELGVPRLEHAHFLQHLAHDHPDVLVVDLHALEAVDLLDFVQQVLLNGARTTNLQNVVRIHRTLGEAVTGAHAITLVHAQVLAGGHFVQSRLRALLDRALGAHGLHEDLALAALDLAEADHAVDLGDRRRILWTTRLEQLGDAGQTARDVARLVRLAANLRDRRSRGDLLTVLHRELCAHRDDEVTDALLLPALLLHDLDVRVELLLAVLDDDALAQTGELVELLGHRFILDDVDEANRARHVRDDRRGVGIPREDHLVPLHRIAIAHHHDGAEGHRQARANLRVLVGALPDDDLAFIGGDDPVILAVLDHDQAIAVFHHAVELGLARGLFGDTRRRSTDVERAQRELRSRLADRLGRDDADGLAEVHHGHGRQVPAVAHPAQPALGLAGEHRTNLDVLDAGLFDVARRVFVDELTRLDENRRTTGFIPLVRILDILGGNVADDALRQRLDD